MRFLILTIGVFFAVIATVTVTLFAAPHLPQDHIIACRSAVLALSDADTRGWYLIDAAHGFAAETPVRAIPFPLIELSPDFSMGISEGMHNAALQQELFLHVYGMRYQERVPITDDGAQERFLDWSPDSRYVLFNRLDRFGRGREGLYALDMHTHTETRLTSGMPLEARWSPDSSQIAYYKSFYEGYHLLNVATGEDTIFADYPGDLYGWSPDGNHVLVRGKKTATGIETPHFVTVDVVSGVQRVVHVPVSIGEAAVWAGHDIIFQSGNYDVWMVGTRGGRAQRVDNGYHCEGIAAWRNTGFSVPCRTRNGALCDR